MDSRACPLPARWRAARPLWGDASFASVAPHVTSRAILAAVRSATVGMPIDETRDRAVHPRPLAALAQRPARPRLLPDSAWRGAESVCDSAVLASWLLEAPGRAWTNAYASSARRIPAARLNVLAGDGDRILATTWGDTLSVLVGPDGVVVASEPYDDDPGWRDIPDRSLLTATPDGVAVTDLGEA